MNAKDIDFGVRVQTLKTGISTVGTITGIICSGHAFARSLCHMKREDDYEYWDKLYPSWRKSYIMQVTFDQPQKSMRREELSEWSLASMSPQTEEELDAEYEKMPYVWCASYPREDLELAEEGD